MPTITLAQAGQISDPIEVGPGTRITATGGYVQWTTGTLTDVRNGVVTWQTWPAGAVAATEDTLRRVVIRGVATGAMTLTWDESKKDEGPDGAYWQESIPSYALDAAGNVVGLVGPDRLISSPSRLAALGNSNRVYFRGRRLADWSYTPAGSNTATGAEDTADGAYAGGQIVTMTQVTTGVGNENRLHSAVPFYPPMLGVLEKTLVTGEISVPSGRFATVTLNNSIATNLLYMQIGPANLLTLTAPDGTNVTATPAGFDQTAWHRITGVVCPTGATTGTLRMYVHYKDTVEKRAFVGSVPYSNNVIPNRLSITQDWTAANTLRVARFFVAEVNAIMTGTSLEAGYVGWAPSPDSARTFAASTYNEQRNPAWLLAQAMSGDSQYVLNHAIGGHRVDQMLSDFSAWALALTPRLIVIGSPTNSIAASLSDGNPTAYMAQARTDYLSMVQQALAADMRVIAIGAEPRHDTVVTSLSLTNYAERALAWNSWARTTLAPLGVCVVDCWSDFVDPVTPNQLVSWANAGDNVHFTWRAQRLRARRMIEAMVR